VLVVDHAVVVGAGIGGLTASLVLSRVAARVTLVERAERPAEVGAALALQPDGMAVLDRLGLLPAVETVSARIDRIDIRSASGRRLLAAGMPDLGTGLDHAIAVRRTDLHRLLLEAVGGVATIERRFGWAALSADPSGAVRIASNHENDPAVGCTTLRADVIVGTSPLPFESKVTYPRGLCAGSVDDSATRQEALVRVYTNLSRGRCSQTLMDRGLRCSVRPPLRVARCRRHAQCESSLHIHGVAGKPRGVALPYCRYSAGNRLSNPRSSRVALLESTMTIPAKLTIEMPRARSMTNPNAARSMPTYVGWRTTRYVPAVRRTA
jgi:hypothetical protein